MLYWQQESLDHATHFLERAYALGSPSARLLGNLGLIKQQKQQFDEAISFYRQSLRLGKCGFTVQFGCAPASQGVWCI